MMRFPPRLGWSLLSARISQKLGFTRATPLVQFLDAAEVLHSGSSHPVSREKIREVVSGDSPVVWIGGSEPLHHPGIAHLVRVIVQSGHFVFLETDGTQLRRRIHEFQPVPRLFLTVRLQPGASELAVEGVRAARLSGFLVCAHARVQVETRREEIAKLIQLTCSLDVDGFVITPSNGGSDVASPDAVALQRKTTEARKLIGNKRWKSFSRFVERVVSGEQDAARNVNEAGTRAGQEVSVDAEGVRIS